MEMALVNAVARATTKTYSCTATAVESYGTPTVSAWTMCHTLRGFARAAPPNERSTLNSATHGVHAEPLVEEEQEAWKEDDATITLHMTMAGTKSGSLSGPT